MDIQMLVCTRCWYTLADIVKDYPQGTPRFGSDLPATITVEDGAQYVVPHRKHCRMLDKAREG